MAPPVLVLDNGASTIKVGLAQDDGEPRLVSNAVVKPKGSSKLYIGHEIETCKDFFGLYYRRPFEKGILTDWDTQKAVWDKLFGPEGMDLTTRSLSLLVTEPYFNLPGVRETYDEMAFEEWEFQSYLNCPPATLIPFGSLFDDPKLPPPECCIVVDSGFSFTHVIPIMNGNVLWANAKRIDVGGKLLTNHLKEIVSFRHWDVMEHTYVMNEVKEACCYVSSSFSEDLEACQLSSRKNPIVQEYVLPDFTSNRVGYIRSGPGAIPRAASPINTDQDQDGLAFPNAPQPSSSGADDPVLYMSNERFTVPEVLFHPSDVGLDQAGLAETIAHVILSLPEDLQGLFWANIGLIGGNFNLPGIEQRLRTELRALAPPEAPIGLYKADNPITEAFTSARAFARTPAYTSCVVTRAEYEESGSSACRRKFGANQFGGLFASKDEDMDVEVDGSEVGRGRRASTIVEATTGTGTGTGGGGGGRGRDKAASAAAKAEAKAAADKESRAARRGARASKGGE